MSQQPQHCIVPTYGADAPGAHEPREKDIRIKGAVGPLHENGMVDNRQQWNISDAVPDSDTFHRTRLKSQPLFSLIAAHQDFNGLSLVIITGQMKEPSGLRPPQPSRDDLSADFFHQRLRPFE